LPNYQRYYLQGGTYFFTVVSHKRQPIFVKEPAIRLFKNCLKDTITIHPFRIDAIVILPDHIHTIWTLPENDSDFSTRWKLVKAAFSKQHQNILTGNLTDSLVRKGESGVWQRRFWEHLIRDQDDFNRHCDYIHYNPVKHGLAKSPSEWKYSSFEKFVKLGIYEPGWGTFVDKTIIDMDID